MRKKTDFLSFLKLSLIYLFAAMIIDFTPWTSADVEEIVKRNAPKPGEGTILYILVIYLPVLAHVLIIYRLTGVVSNETLNIDQHRKMSLNCNNETAYNHCIELISKSSGLKIMDENRSDGHLNAQTQRTILGKYVKFSLTEISSEKTALDLDINSMVGHRFMDWGTAQRISIKVKNYFKELGI